MNIAMFAILASTTLLSAYLGYILLYPEKCSAFDKQSGNILYEVAEKSLATCNRYEEDDLSERMRRVSTPCVTYNRSWQKNCRDESNSSLVCHGFRCIDCYVVQITSCKETNQ